MRFLSLAEVLELHRMLLDQSGGAPGIRDLGALESALAQPRIAFGGQDLSRSREQLVQWIREKIALKNARG